MKDDQVKRELEILKNKCSEIDNNRQAIHSLRNEVAALKKIVNSKKKADRVTPIQG